MSIQSNIIKVTSLAGILAHERQRKLEAAAKAKEKEAKALANAEKEEAKAQPVAQPAAQPVAQQELTEKETFKKEKKAQPRDKAGRFTKIQQEKRATAMDKLAAEQNRLRFNPRGPEPLEMM